MKKTNKGFSLVELIIVIAIMALLVGVMTPQLLKYVNRSKKAVDITSSENIGAPYLYALLDPLEEGSLALNKYTALSAGYCKSENRTAAGGWYRVLAFQNAGYQYAEFQLMSKPSGMTDAEYALAKDELKEICSRIRPLKFTQDITLDQWVICCDEAQNIYVFATGGVNQYRYYIQTHDDGASYYVNRDGGSITWKAYMLWPTTCSSYLALNDPSGSAH